MFSVVRRTRWISFFDEVQGEIGMSENELAEMRAIDHGGGRRQNGDHRRRARQSVEHHLANVFSRAVEIDDDFLARSIAGKDLHLAVRMMYNESFWSPSLISTVFFGK
jgi:hypothetical protein